MRNALNEAINENTALRDKVAELEALLSESDLENSKKDNAIKELYNLIKVKEKDITLLQ
jgi:regulator of replication initiation timing